MSQYEKAWYNAKTDEVHTPKGRMVYPNLLEPRAIKGQEGSKPKYGVTLLLKAGSDLEALKTAAAEAAKTKFGQKPTKIKSPFLQTADYERLAEFKEAFPQFIRLSATTEFPPFLFGPDAQQFKGDASDIYSGRWAVAAVRPYAYDQAGNKGVAFGLQRIQFLDHDEAIAGGRVATSEGFSPVEVGGAKPASTDAIWD
jgi:hypothetical protein